MPNSTGGLNHDIPPELMTFLGKGSYSLLIAGGAGTGKTSLALSVIRAGAADGNFFYVSTRTSPTQLFKDFPWLEGAFSRNGSRQKKGPAAPDPERFADSRLDEPAMLFEKITNQLMDYAAPMIVIDSWDDVASQMDGEALLNNLRVLQTWRERASAKMVFITGTAEQTHLDFLLDGKVTLKQHQLDGRRLRELTIVKLRGVTVNRASHFFSLRNGVFTSFSPLEIGAAKPKFPRQRPERRTRPQTAMRTGYPDLDSLIGGGLKPNSVLELDLDQDVSPDLACAMLSRLVANVLWSGGHVAAHRIDGLAGRSIGESMGLGAAQGLKPFQPKAYGKGERAVSLELARAAAGSRPRLMITSVAAVNEELDPLGNGRGFALAIQMSRRAFDGTVVVSRRGEGGQAQIPEFADVSLRIRNVEGIHFAEPKAPWSSLMAIVNDAESGLELHSVV